MDRRAFMKGVAVAAIASPAVASAAVLKVNGIRVSSEKGDVGYRPYCIARGDAKKVKIFLDGEYQRYAVMADENLGVVKRIVVTPEGNFAHDGKNVLYEHVYGDVTVLID